MTNYIFFESYYSTNHKDLGIFFLLILLFCFHEDSYESLMVVSYIRLGVNTTIRKPHMYGTLRSYSKLALDQENLKFKYLKGISLYENPKIIPVQRLESLEFLYNLDQSLINKDKESAIRLISEFFKTKDSKYNYEYGQIKEDIGRILKMHRKQTKITPLDVLEAMGFDHEELKAMGVLETTLNSTKKNCVSSTVLEVLAIKPLKKKYPFITKIQYCQDGAIKVECVNHTGQKNPDYVISIKKLDGTTVDLAYDSKALTQAALTHLTKHHVVTTGNEHEIAQSIFEKSVISPEFNNQQVFDENNPTLIISTQDISDSLSNGDNNNY